MTQSKYRVVAAGCGGMANLWLDYAAGNDRIEIVGLVDVVEANARAMAEKRGLRVPVFANVAEAIEKTGADPVSVYCHEFNPPGSWYAGNASAVCVFEMSDGSVFTYRGSWCSEGFNTSWESDWRIIGSKGTARWDGFSAPVAEVVDEDKAGGFASQMKSARMPEPWVGREGHHGCLDEMFAALEEGRPAETDCRDNLKSVAMVFGAVESALKGEKVRLG
ncbi:hypothetical protein ACF3MZ_00050 [Paenibacillaceae bacterium WGS1546]|uniref:hypothetical protein n=1 Tax=Cohnella sp. WGS1546 TaxID=3366810 RepID=UPI00372D0477